MLASRFLRWSVIAVLTIADTAILIPSASAQEVSTIRGDLYIAGKTSIDPPPGERKNTHAYLTLEGPGARRMYDAIEIKEQEDACRGDGWKIKRVGNLACAVSRGRRKAQCDFALDLTRGGLAPGSPC